MMKTKVRIQGSSRSDSFGMSIEDVESGVLIVDISLNKEELALFLLHQGIKTEVFLYAFGGAMKTSAITTAVEGVGIGKLGSFDSLERILG